MSQTIHVARIKFLSEELTKDLNYMEVLGYLKKMFAEEKNVDKLKEKFIEEIETKYLLLSAYDEIEKLLTTGSKVQLHPESRLYFVTEELWSVLRTQIFKDSQNIKEEDHFFEMAEDSMNIKSFYEKKMLVFEAS